MSARDEFEKVYLEYTDKMFRYFYWQTKNYYLAQDLTSEVFVRAWQSWGKFKQEYVQAWLYKIAHNLLVDWYRKKKEVVIKRGVDISYDDNLLERMQTDGEVQRLGRALESLPENLKRVAILRFIDNFSAREVATILEISEVNVRVLQHRALIKLREVLKDE